MSAGTSMTEAVTKESVLDALKSVKTPHGQDLTASAILSEVVVNKGKVYFALSVPEGEAKAYDPVRKAAENAVKALPGVAGAMVTLTADAKARTAMPAAKPAG